MAVSGQGQTRAYWPGMDGLARTHPSTDGGALKHGQSPLRSRPVTSRLRSFLSLSLSLSLSLFLLLQPIASGEMNGAHNRSTRKRHQQQPRNVIEERRQNDFALERLVRPCGTKTAAWLGKDLRKKVHSGLRHQRSTLCKRPLLTNTLRLRQAVVDRDVN